MVKVTLSTNLWTLARSKSATELYLRLTEMLCVVSLHCFQNFVFLQYGYRRWVNKNKLQ